MATSRTRKPAAPRKSSQGKTKTRSKRVLDTMAPHELASILRAVLDKHPELCAEAEQIAIDMIAAPSADDVADEVHAAVTSLGIESFLGRTGKQARGYVGPSEAAWELLGEAVEDQISAMKRCADLGLKEAAEAICCGILIGLNRAEGTNSDGPLGSAPDFPAEQARYALVELIRASPPKDRRAIRDRLVDSLGNLVPSWDEMMRWAADGALKGGR